MFWTAAAILTGSGEIWSELHWEEYGNWGEEGKGQSRVFGMAAPQSLRATGSRTPAAGREQSGPQSGGEDGCSEAHGRRKEEGFALILSRFMRRTARRSSPCRDGDPGRPANGGE